MVRFLMIFFSMCFSIFLKFSVVNMYYYYCIFFKLYVLHKKESWPSKSMCSKWGFQVKFVFGVFTWL